ncbi:MAG TPA: CsbD family protein [Candidatus Limnocylindrales bacterium]|nr:CsbD family protein [Candidatus Limnocylindrales bacterium]
MQKERSVDVKSGNQDKIEGTAKTLAGKIKEEAGKAVGNPRLEAKGDCDQIKGSAQKKVGEIKKVFGK